MNRNVEQYLKRATRGLWGRKCQEVREELSAHIKARVTAHRIAGLNETDAIRISLEELGHPKEVNTGMLKLHTLPTSLGLGSIMAALCAVVVVMVSSTVAQSLSVTEQYPAQGCLEGRTLEPINGLSFPCEGFRSELWTNVQALKEVLEPQGGKFEIYVKSSHFVIFRFNCLKKGLPFSCQISLIHGLYGVFKSYLKMHAF